MMGVERCFYIIFFAILINQAYSVHNCGFSTTECLDSQACYLGQYSSDKYFCRDCANGVNGSHTCGFKTTECCGNEKCTLDQWSDDKYNCQSCPNGATGSHKCGFTTIECCGNERCVPSSSSIGPKYTCSTS